jgi:dihydrofolate reductase
MGKVRFTMYASLDGYVEDADGSIDFAEPDDELHRLANEQAREASAFLFGRGLYETMEDFWTDAAREDAPEIEADFARAYVATPRLVFSDTLESVGDGVRLVRSADAVAEVTRLKEEMAGPLDLGGPGLAASLVDLIDEYRLYLLPVVVGGGKPFFATGRERLHLRLAEQRSYSSGAVYLRYERAAGV